MDRPEICIGTDNFHTSEKLKNLFGELFEGLNFTVKYNEPFKGSIVPLKFYNKEIRVQSIMIEVRRDLYMNEQSGEKNGYFVEIQNKLNLNIYEVLNKI
jgi:N-formylglutamate amidohydrolase